MSDLTKSQKRFIVQCLAHYMSPSEVVAAVKDEFDVVVTKQRVNYYSPKHSEDLAKEWRDIFDAARKKYDDGMNDVAATHQRFRIEMLDQGAREARKAKNWPLMAHLLKQIAQEQGGVFTNKTEITLNPPKPLEQMTDNEFAEYRANVHALKSRR